MTMTFVPINQAKWTPQCAVMYGYADPYDKRKKRDPDTIIMKVDGVYKCAVGPDWCAPFVAEVHDPDSAKYECAVAWGRRTWDELATIKKTPARPSAASPC